MNKSTNKLLNIFYKKATLLSDVAARSMFQLMDKEDPDYIHALKFAAKGAIDVITFGSNICEHEITHYQKTGKKKRRYNVGSMKIPTAKVNINNIDNYIHSLTKIKELFDDEDAWDPGFGGKAWSGITNSLISVCKQYKKYLLSNKDSSENIETGNMLIAYMTMFDDNCHNTGSIFEKLADYETEYFGFKYDNLVSSPRKILNIRNLMQTSSNKADLLKLIEPDLETKLPFKETIQNIKLKDQDYYTDSSVRVKESLEHLSVAPTIRNKCYYISSCFHNNMRDLNAYIHKLKESTEFVSKNINELILDNPQTKILKDNLHNLLTIIDKENIIVDIMLDGIISFPDGLSSIVSDFENKKSFQNETKNKILDFDSKMNRELPNINAELKLKYKANKSYYLKFSHKIKQSTKLEKRDLNLLINCQNKLIIASETAVTKLKELKQDALNIID
ncbi:MAG: hypothetical protein ACOYLO_00090 [Ferruginibacter sp.]